MVTRKVANPAPSVLALVNPKRRKNMATKRRKRSTKRRAVHHTAARKTATRRTRAHSNPPRHHRVHARRHHSPMRHHRRRRNPSAAGGEILNFTVAGIGLGIATPIVGGFVGRFLPFGQYNAPILSFGTGWLLSKAFGMFGFTRRFSHASFVFGAATAAMQVLQPIVARTLVGAAPQPSTMSGPGWRRMGMRGIAAVHGIPPEIMPPPMPPPHGGMAGVATVPGVWNR